MGEPFVRGDLMVTADAERAICPIVRGTCVASQCMAWRWAEPLAKFAESGDPKSVFPPDDWNGDPVEPARPDDVPENWAWVPETHDPMFPHHESVTEARARFFGLMRDTPHLIWLLLTKRPGNIAGQCAELGGLPPNAAIGCTVVTQEEANRDIPKLLAADERPLFRFVSVEPMLGPIDLRSVWTHCPVHDSHSGFCIGACPDRRRIDWVIVGGESGPHARPMHPDWVRSLRDQCDAARVPFLFKRWGEWKEHLHEEHGSFVEEVEEDSRADAWSVAAAVGRPGLLTRGGRFYRTAEEFDADDGSDGPARLMVRMGKTRAGRLLDGREHSQRPEAPR